MAEKASGCRRQSLELDRAERRRAAPGRPGRRRPPPGFRAGHPEARRGGVRVATCTPWAATLPRPSALGWRGPRHSPGGPGPRRRPPGRTPRPYPRQGARVPGTGSPAALPAEPGAVRAAGPLLLPVPGRRPSSWFSVPPAAPRPAQPPPVFIETFYPPADSWAPATVYPTYPLSKASALWPKPQQQHPPSLRPSRRAPPALPGHPSEEALAPKHAALPHFTAAPQNRGTGAPRAPGSTPACLRYPI